MQMKKRSYFEWVRIGFLLHFCVLFLLMAGLIGFIFFQSFLRQMRYEPVQGTILISKAEPCPDGMFTPKITFSYTVDRMTYTTGKYRDDGMQVCLKEAEVNELLARFPQGAVVDTWFDPNHVKLAVLDRSLGIVQKIFLIIVAGFSVILLIAMWFRHREKIKRAPVAPETSSSLNPGKADS